MALELRPYQRESVEAVLREWDGGRRRTLLVQATGTGKTVVFSHVAKRVVDAGGRVLILAHRGELLDQAAEKLHAATGLRASVEKAEQRSLHAWERVTVGSVQSLCRQERYGAMERDRFDAIIVDEAHHILADSYMRIMDWFDGAKVLGVTATADRADRRSLGSFFDSLAYEYGMKDGIRDGYLVPIEALTIPLGIDLTGVKVERGDFQAAGVGHALDPYLERIADEMAETCRGRRTVVFLPLVATAKKFRGILEERGLRAAEVDGASADRAEVLADFAAGRYDVLCNAMLLTEGWDCPAVDCIAVLRPTKVRSLYAQMVGRGTRPSPETGKGKLLLLDFLWHVERHSLVRPAHLFAQADDVAAKMCEAADAAGGPVDVMGLEAQAERDAVEERERALADALAAQRRRKRGLVDPMQYAASIQAEALTGYIPAFGIEAGPPTDRQLGLLEGFGIYPGVGSAGEADALLAVLEQRKRDGMATPKQIRFLEARGFRHVGAWAKGDANAMIARISRNGWRVPAGVSPAEYVPGR